MEQEPIDLRKYRAKVEGSVAPLPSRYMPYVPGKAPEHSASFAPTVAQVGVTTRCIRQVVVLEVVGHLGDVVEELDWAIQLALAGEPRGVVADLSAALVDPVGVAVLAAAGRHVRDWSGIPVALACADPLVGEVMGAHLLGAHLLVSESAFLAMNAVLATPDLIGQSLVLAAHPTAPRAARDFVTRALLDWQLSRVIPVASRVVTALVASSMTHAGTAIALSVVWDRGALRLSVREHGPARPGQPPLDPDLPGRGFAVVAALSRAFGVLPTGDGGKAVWAVLEAPKPRPSTNDQTSTTRR